MRYLIGRNGEGLFLIEDDVEASMVATVPYIGSTYTSLQLVAIRDYLRKEGNKAEPRARQDYERIMEEGKYTPMGYGELIEEIQALAGGKKLPPSKISQALIKKAHTNILHRFELCGIRM